jgi:hypothetical protein
MSDLTVTKKVHFQRGQRSRKAMREGESKDVPEGRVPRVARLMALAIRFDRLIRDGVVSDQAELARLGRVSRARVSQIMNLLQLAPDIQEAILFLPRTERGRDVLTERELQPIAAEADWGRQRRMSPYASHWMSPITFAIVRSLHSGSRLR